LGEGAYIRMTHLAPNAGARGIVLIRLSTHHFEEISIEEVEETFEEKVGKKVGMPLIW
jgi:uncharacterized protein YbjQ (UPF0145 family)